jgi:ABC-type protease/lipase transport system fused ATPase/permease subunit
MMIRGFEIGAKLVAIIVGALVLVAVVGLTVRSCDKRRSQAAQARVERSQAEAASNSAADAINTVTGVGTNQAASEDLGRTNERDIRAAEGANARVGAGVNAAGRAALCKRAAYRGDPKCAAFRRQQ